MEALILLVPLAIAAVAVTAMAAENARYERRRQWRELWDANLGVVQRFAKACESFARDIERYVVPAFQDLGDAIEAWAKASEQTDPFREVMKEQNR